MSPIPFYKSSVFMTAMLALGIQALNALSDPSFVEHILALDRHSIALALSMLATGGVAALRATSSVQPLSMGKVDDVQSKAPLLVACATGLMVCMAGCQTIEQSPATARLVTQYAVAKYLEGKKTDAVRFESAARIVKIATDLKTVSAGAEVRLDALRVAVSGALAGQPLSPADRVLADGLVDVLIAELEGRFKSGGGILSPEQLVLVNDVLAWIIAVASTVPAPQVAT